MEDAMAITKNQMSAVKTLSDLLKVKPTSLLNKNAMFEKNNASQSMGKTANAGKSASSAIGTATRQAFSAARSAIAKPKRPGTSTGKPKPGGSIVKQDDPIGTATVTCGALNVRSGPGLDNPRIGGLTKGKTVNVYEENGEWIKIGYGTDYGWVCAKYTNYKPQEPVVTPEPQPEPEPEPEPEPQPPAFEQFDIVTTDYLNLRDKPGSGTTPAEGSTVLVTIPPGTRLTVLEEKNGWYRVVYDGKEGWCCSEWTNKVVTVDGGGAVPEGAEGIAYDVPIDGQNTSYNCGAASGAMALAARGLNISEAQVAAKAETNSSDGTYVYKLVNALNHFIGSNVYKYTVVNSYSIDNFYNLLHSSLSAVCMPIHRISTKNHTGSFGYSSGGHYVCTTGVYTSGGGEKRAIINDPYSGGWWSNGNQGQKIDITVSELKQCGTDMGDAYVIHGG